MAKLKRRVAMSLMAHPDDCELLAYGTLALLRQAGWEVHIITMTPGDCGSMQLDPIEIARVRRTEAAKAAKIIGATYTCLESRDLYVTYDEPTLRGAMIVTRQIAPTLIFTHSLTDYMIDHECTARIARGASFGFAVPNVCPGPVVKGSMLPYVYYADPIEGTDVYGDRVEPSTYVDIGKSMFTKTRALKAHASQREWLMQHHGMDHYVKSMNDWAAQRGEEAGVKFAEGFRQHKGHPYPADCILRTELGDVVKHR